MRRPSTPPDAWLYRKGPGKEAKLRFMRHALIENRNGLVVDACLTEANGHDEWIAAPHMIEPRAEGRGRSRSAPTRPMTPSTSSTSYAR